MLIFKGVNVIAMTSFEKSLINELKGIRKELQKMNKKDTEVKIDGERITEGLMSASNVCLGNYQSLRASNTKP